MLSVRCSMFLLFFILVRWVFNSMNSSNPITLSARSAHKFPAFPRASASLRENRLFVFWYQNGNSKNLSRAETLGRWELQNGDALTRVKTVMKPLEWLLVVLREAHPYIYFPRASAPLREKCLFVFWYQNGNSKNLSRAETLGRWELQDSGARCARNGNGKNILARRRRDAGNG